MLQLQAQPKVAVKWVQLLWQLLTRHIPDKEWRPNIVNTPAPPKILTLNSCQSHQLTSLSEPIITTQLQAQPSNSTTSTETANFSQEKFA